MPTKEKLESALKNAHAAGDVAAAKALANALKNGQYDQPEAAEATPSQPEQSLLQKVDSAILSNPIGRGAAEFAAAANRSIFDMIDFFGMDNVNAALQLAGSDKRVPTARGSFGSEGGYMEPGLARDAVQAAGQILPMAVASGQVLRSAAGRLPAAMPGESALRGVARQLGSSTVAQDAGYGALSAAGSEIGEEIGGDAGAVIGSVALPVAAGSIAGKVSRASQSLKAPIPSAEKQLLEQADDAGIRMLTSDVLPPQTFAGKIAQQTAEKIPVAGTGGVREQQQALRQKAVQEVADKYGEFSYDAIVKSLQAQKSRIKNAAGSVLQRVSKQLDAVGEIETPFTKQAIQSARSELEKPGVIQASSAMDDLGKLIKALESPQTFTSLKENRTAFREIVKSTDKADRSQLTSRAKALLENVYGGMTKDMEALARKNLPASEFMKWKNANTVYADEATKLTKTKLKNILDKGDVTPESVKQMLFSQNPSEQRMLYRSLTNEGRKNARSAIISKIVGDLSRRASGFTPNSFATELRKHGGAVNTFFKGEERRQLEGLRRVLDATRRAQDAAVTTPTGQQLIGGLGVTGIALDPVTTIGAAGTVGGFARLYESPIVRDSLLRLGSVQSGSSAYAPSLLAAQLALQFAAQKETEKGADKEQRQQ